MGTAAFPRGLPAYPCWCRETHSTAARGVNGHGRAFHLRSSPHSPHPSASPAASPFSCILQLIDTATPETAPAGLDHPPPPTRNLAAHQTFAPLRELSPPQWSRRAPKSRHESRFVINQRTQMAHQYWKPRKSLGRAAHWSTWPPCPKLRVRETSLPDEANQEDSSHHITFRASCCADPGDG